MVHFGLMQEGPTALCDVAIAGRNFTYESVSDQNALIARIQTQADLDAFPYGLTLWPSAIGLAEYITNNEDRFTGMAVLELGCGVGLAGMAAAAAGARVVQTDYQMDIIKLAKRNARLNNLDIDVRPADWRDWPESLTNFDYVIGTDILYERSLHGVLRDLLTSFCRRGAKVILADPMRPQSLDALAEWEVQSFIISQNVMDEALESPPRSIWILEICHAIKCN